MSEISIGNPVLDMDEHQRSLRRAANQAFMESLDQLAVSLRQESKPAQKVDQQQPDGAVAPPINLRALEEAAADIEQFMQTTQDR